MRTRGRQLITRAGSVWLIWCCLTAGGELSAMPVERLGDGEQEFYVSSLLPLPKEVAFRGKVAMAPGQPFEVLTDAHPGELAQAAAEELAAFLENETDRPVARATGASGGERGFAIRLGLASDQSVRDIKGIPPMASLPNASQAYAVVPLNTDAGDVSGLGLVGQGEQGLYHAAATFMQLVEATVKRASSGPDDLALPIAAIRDWPDIGERGFWGSYTTQSLDHIGSLSRRKFNVIETHVRRQTHTLGDDGDGELAVPEELLDAARGRAIKIVPVITHLDHLHASVFEQRPDLRAVGEKAQIGRLQALCHAKPEAQQLLSQWMSSLARLPGVTDVSAWLSEVSNCPQCSCAECAEENWFVGEVRLLVQAWEDAREVNPDLRLRILLTQGSYPYNDLVLAAVPPEVGVSYYSGMHTYSVSREPMIYPLLRDFARSGRWLGVYPQLLGVWKYNTPFPCPDFVHARMNEFVEVGLSNVCGRLHPIEWPYYPMSFDAAAEWSWNARGRSVREFVEAWAVREGLQSPEAVADWAEAIGPVIWDVHEGRFPLGFHKLVRSLGGEELQLGEDAFAGFPTAECFEEDLAACEQAARLAEQIGSPAMTAETKVAASYVTLLRAIHLLSEKMAAQGEVEEGERVLVKATCDGLDGASQSLLDGLREWYAAVQQESGAQPWRVDSTTGNIEQNCSEVSALCEWMAAQSKGTTRVLMSGFGKPESVGDRTAFNTDETGVGDGTHGWATFTFVVKDFGKTHDLHLLVWGKSDPVNLIICTEGQGKGFDAGGKWARVEPQGSILGQEQWDELVFRLTPELLDRSSRRQIVGVGSGDSQIWVAECWLEETDPRDQ